MVFDFLQFIFTSHIGPIFPIFSPGQRVNLQLDYVIDAHVQEKTQVERANGQFSIAPTQVDF